MARSRSLTFVTGIGLLVATLLVGVPALHAEGLQARAKEQLEFGVKMAQRGLWSEALFRFRQANKIDPQNAAVYNNLAVAHEALGLFEEALALYREGLELSPQDKGLRNNYARFLDFYNRFRPDEEGPEEGEGGQSSEVAEEVPEATTTPPGAESADGPPGAVSGLRNFSRTVRVGSAISAG